MDDTRELAEAKFEIEKLHGGMDYWKEQAEAAEKELKVLKEKKEIRYEWVG